MTGPSAYDLHGGVRSGLPWVISDALESAHTTQQSRVLKMS